MPVERREDEREWMLVRSAQYVEGRVFSGPDALEPVVVVPKSRLTAAEAEVERLRAAPTVRLLPDAPLNADTELAFIDGQPFVNAAKHEQVVLGHVAARDSAEAKTDRWVEQANAANADAEALTAERDRLAAALRESERAWLDMARYLDSQALEGAAGGARKQAEAIRSALSVLDREAKPERGSAFPPQQPPKPGDR